MNWDCCRKEENNLSSVFILYETNRTELVLLQRSFNLDIRGNLLRLGWCSTETDCPEQCEVSSLQSFKNRVEK